MIRICICGKNIKVNELYPNKRFCSDVCKRIGRQVVRRRERDKLYFGGKREYVLKRDRYKCVRCGGIGKIVVHHKDKNGRGSSTPNNSINNLEVLCGVCHRKAHREKSNNQESIKYVKQNILFSNRELARRLNISHPTVAEIRRAL